MRRWSSLRATCYFRKPTRCASDSLDTARQWSCLKDEAFTKEGFILLFFSELNTLPAHVADQTIGAGTYAHDETSKPGTLNDR